MLLKLKAEIAAQLLAAEVGRVGLSAMEPVAEDVADSATFLAEKLLMRCAGEEKWADAKACWEREGFAETASQLLAAQVAAGEDVVELTYDKLDWLFAASQDVQTFQYCEHKEPSDDPAT